MPFVSAQLANPVPPDTLTSPDGYLTATVDGAGVLLKASFPADAGIKQVRFTRSPSTLVRSGNDSWASAGVAYAYDAEAPQSAASTWFATPVMADGSLGHRSDGVSLQAPSLKSSSHCWLKPTGSPSLALQVRLKQPLPEFAQQGRQYFSDVPGSEFPAGGFDIPTVQPFQVTARLDTPAAVGVLLQTIKAGQMLVQFDPAVGIDDLYALVTASNLRYPTFASDPQRRIDLTLQPIKRPTPLGAWISIPGNTVGDLAMNVATVGDIPTAYPTVGSMVEAQ